MLMENKVYDVLKFLALVVLPALATFYAAIAAVWGLPYTEQVVGTITAVDTLGHAAQDQRRQIRGKGVSL